MTDWSSGLRSSATPEGGCHTHAERRRPAPPWRLRSSATPEGGCPRPSPGAPERPPPVAILSHPGGWLPPQPRTGPPRHTLGCDPQPPRRVAATPRPARRGVQRRSCDPQPPRRVAATTMAGVIHVSAIWLRSSATPEGGCHWPPPPDALSGRCSCDPQPPRRVAATSPEKVSAGPGQGCDPQPPRRVAATAHSAR